jgi:hypothetical protein
MVDNGGTDAITLWDPGSIIFEIHKLLNLVVDGGGSSVCLVLHSHPSLKVLVLDGGGSSVCLFLHSQPSLKVLVLDGGDSSV